MNILNNFQDINTSIQSTVTAKKQPQTELSIAPKNEYKKDVLDLFSEKVINKNDINDMVETPRAIFKGYLCFTAGTTVNAIAGLIKQGKAANVMRIIGSLVSVYGTYNFVKPYLIRNENLTKSQK